MCDVAWGNSIKQTLLSYYIAFGMYLESIFSVAFSTNMGTFSPAKCYLYM